MLPVAIFDQRRARSVFLHTNNYTVHVRFMRDPQIRAFGQAMKTTRTSREQEREKGEEGKKERQKERHPPTLE